MRIRADEVICRIKVKTAFEIAATSPLVVCNG